MLGLISLNILQIQLVIRKYSLLQTVARKLDISAFE